MAILNHSRTNEAYAPRLLSRPRSAELRYDRAWYFKNTLYLNIPFPLTPIPYPLTKLTNFHNSSRITIWQFGKLLGAAKHYEGFAIAKGGTLAVASVVFW